MQRQVQVLVQKWEPIGGGKFKIQIKNRDINLTNITHEGIPYVTVKRYGRGRYTVRRDPSYVPPAPMGQNSAISSPGDGRCAQDVAPQNNAPQEAGRTNLAYTPSPNRQYELGDGCETEGCPGFLELEPVVDCSCHISAPCNKCVDNPLVCLHCGWSPDAIFQEVAQ